MRSPSPVRLKETWVLCFILGIIMLNYPFLEIFNKPVTLFGIPLLVLYLTFGWLFSIFVIFLFSRYLGSVSAESDNHSGDAE